MTAKKGMTAELGGMTVEFSGMTVKKG